MALQRSSSNYHLYYLLPSKGPVADKFGQHISRFGYETSPQVIIRILLIAAMLGLFDWFLRQRMSIKTQAWSKIGVLLFVLAAVLAVLFPESTNTIAHKVGVGRGADLLLYFLTVIFLTHVLQQYIHRQDDRARVDSLARKLAILDANTNAKNQRLIKRYGHQITK